jgi:trk system potassium uptake protein TrkH
MNVLSLHPQRLGFFLNIGFVFSIILSAAYDSSNLTAVHAFSSPAPILGLLLTCGGLSLFLRIDRAKFVMSTILICSGAISLFFLYDQPLKGYLILCLLLLSAFFLRGIKLKKLSKPFDFRQKLLFSLVAFASINWMLVHVFKIAFHSIAQISVLLSCLLCLAFAFIDFYYAKRLNFLSLVLLFLTCFVLFLPPLLSMQAHLLTASQVSLAAPIYGYITLGFKFPLKQKLLSTIEALFFHPEGAVIVLFLMLCSLGTVLLFIPASSATGQSLTLVNAAFTAVSAVCVTGLTVLDTALDFTFTGQLFILLLIQLGGLGIMTLSSLAIFLLGQRLSVQQETTLAKVVGHKLKDKIQHTLLRIIVFTFVTEFLGALLLTFSFLYQGRDFGDALWRGIFTAISAFCNAGFALDTSNLIGMQNEPLVLHIVALLIILGGLSPAFVLGIPTMLRGSQIPIQNRLIILSSIVLLLGGTILIGIFEWNHSLAHLDFIDKLHNAWFQSVTTRTAGFNSVDMALLSQPTAFLMIVLMFIGGSPGGTAGGIKTTTFGVAVALILSTLRGKSEVILFNRRLLHDTVFRALAALLLSLAIGVVGSIGLLLSQDLTGTQAVFEVFSALGTVGLSLGITAQLDSIGKCILMICMFMGRVGPITIFLFALEQSSRSRWEYPTEDVVVT